MRLHDLPREKEPWYKDLKIYSPFTSNSSTVWNLTPSTAYEGDLIDYRVFGNTSRTYTITFTGNLNNFMSNVSVINNV